MSTQEIIVGIDLGTTNSLVAWADASGPRLLADAEGEVMLPSVVRFPTADLGGAIIGREARRHAVEFPEQTVHSVKRLMGKSIEDVADDLPYLSYRVVEGEHHTARVRVHDRLISPQEISALILRRLRATAEAALAETGAKVQKAVVTVPAWFDDAERQATRDAGRIAGLDVVRIVNEPTAAALAYGIGRSGEPETIAVFDLGGGTFDVSILQITPGSSLGDETDADEAPGTTDHRQGAQDADADAGFVPLGVPGRNRGGGAADSRGGAEAAVPADESFFQVISTAGDTHLGGDDVDRMIVELVQREIREQFGQQLHFPPSTRQALRQFAEATKIRLSSEDSATVEVDLGDGRLYRRTIARDEFERMIRPWVERALASCTRALRDAKMTAADLDRVVLVGGSTRIPLVRRMVGEFFGTDPYTALNPDHVVALGAAVQASILAGTTQEALLLDVIPLSLGIETMGGAIAKLIMRNSIVPCRVSEKFSTSLDGQTSIKIHVLQGERELARDCRSLGEFHLRGIPPMPAGIPQLEVTFHVDANGILNVSAVERRSRREASIQIVPNHGLSRSEVDRMELESYQYAREDMTAHRIVDLSVNSRLSVKWIREQLQRVGDALEPDYRADLEARAAEVDTFIERAEADPSSVDPEAFLRAKIGLDEASVRLHEIAITKTLREE